MIKPRFVACLFGPLLGLATGCPSATVDPGEGVGDTIPTGPQVEFSPGTGIVPFPNVLAYDLAAKKVKIGASPCESATAAAIRTGVLNKLDGFGTYQTGLQFTVTEMPDMATVAGHVKVYKLGSSLTEVQTVAIPTVSIRYTDAASCATPKLVPAITLIPLAPLEQKTTYAVAVTAGLNTATGPAFGPAAEWQLVRSATDPVTIDGGVVTVNHTPIDPSTTDGFNSLVGIDGLWKLHAPVMSALAAAGTANDTVLLAWSFTTATVTDPLDPTVAGSVAANIPNRAFALFQFPPGVSAAGQGEAFLNAATPAGTCNLIPCNAVADVFGAGFFSDQYQQTVPNPLGAALACKDGAGTAVACPPIPNAWADPVAPAATTSNPVALTTLIITPKGAMPANGWPTVIFGHGLGSSKESLAVFGPQLAAAGFASVAIDFQDHGSRAVRTRTDAECADPASADPTNYPECFALFLSTDLAATRDNFRQTILDLQGLTKALVKCNAGTGCAGPGGITFKVDKDKLVYAGISLGGIIGTTFNSVEPQTKAAVLNVPGVGLIDILENTQTAAIRCSVVDALIDAGVLQGTKWDGANAGLCVAQDQGWKTQPGYQSFSNVARWVLDPGDGANFVQRLNTTNAKKYLIQEVVNDQVVPNIATDREAGLLGFTAPGAADKLDCDFIPQMVDPADHTAACPVPPSAAITTNITMNKWVRYTDLPAAARVSPATGNFLGNAYQHASLLRPVYTTGTTNPSPAGILGTVRIETDAITFLFANQ